MNREVKVVYQDGDRIRALRGVIEDDPNFPGFIQVIRRDGVVRIRKDLIHTIEAWNRGEVSDGNPNESS